jgi:hypothetical protein
MPGLSSKKAGQKISKGETKGKFFSNIHYIQKLCSNFVN